MTVFVACIALLARNRSAVIVLLSATLLIDGLDGAEARRRGISYETTDSALDRYSELALCSCFAADPSLAASVLLASSVLNCFTSVLFDRLTVPALPIQQALLLAVVLRS